MKKILSYDPDFPPKQRRVFAHLLDDGTIDIDRDQRHHFTIIGKDFTLIGSNPQGHNRTVIIVKDGKLIEDDIVYKEDVIENEPKEPAPKEPEPTDTEPAKA